MDSAYLPIPPRPIAIRLKRVPSSLLGAKLRWKGRMVGDSRLQGPEVLRRGMRECRTAPVPSGLLLHGCARTCSFHHPAAQAPGR